jgi:hypothetical protein
MERQFKTGDTIWCLERDECEDETEVSGFIFVAQNEECVIVSSDPVGYDGSISEYLIEESAENMGTDVYAFPIDNAFQTKEAAEAEKERLEHGQN